MSIDNSKSNFNWYHCTNCGKKIIPVTKETTIINAELFCKGCKAVQTPLIINGKHIVNYETAKI